MFAEYHTGKLVYLQFNLEGATAEHRVALQEKIYETLENNGVYLFMLNLSTTGTGFGVPRSLYPLVQDLLDGLVLPLGKQDRAIYLFQIGQVASREVETQAGVLGSLGEVQRLVADVTEGCTMVSLIGHEYMQQPGVFLGVLTALHDAQIGVLQTSDSDFSLSCLIPEAESERAVRLLHEKFLSEEESRIED